MFQHTVAVSVSRQKMPVDGVSTTKCAVVLQLLVLMKQTGFRSVAHSIMHVYPCVYFYVCSDAYLFCAQLNETNTTYMDVCPLLEPSPSTPTGDYVQPVNVARDIELQTRNLPAPVSLAFTFIYNTSGNLEHWGASLMQSSINRLARLHQCMNRACKPIANRDWHSLISVSHLCTILTQWSFCFV